MSIGGKRVECANYQSVQSTNHASASTHPSANATDGSEQVLGPRLYDAVQVTEVLHTPSDAIVLPKDHRLLSESVPLATLEEENVESISEMVVQQLEMPLTGDAKKEQKKIKLEAMLRDVQAKVESVKKELETVIKEKEKSVRQLKEEKEKIAAIIKKYKDKIAELEKKKSEQQAEYSIKIEILQNELKEMGKRCNGKVINLMGDEHKLKLKIEEMSMNEEKLKRKLNAANLETANLRYKSVV